MLHDFKILLELLMLAHAIPSQGLKKEAERELARFINSKKNRMAGAGPTGTVPPSNQGEDLMKRVAPNKENNAKSLN